MRDRAEVVEELAEQIPSAFARHRRGAEQEIARFGDGILQQKPIAVRAHVAEAFVGRRAGTVVGVCRGREPALVDAAAMPAERVQIVGVQPQPPARNHEGARHPRGLEAERAASSVERGFDVRALHNQCSIGMPKQ